MMELKKRTPSERNFGGAKRRYKKVRINKVGLFLLYTIF